MARKKRAYDDDDGRTIADMSGVERQNLWLPRNPRAEEDRRRAQEAAEDQEPVQYTKEEERWAILGALKAALLIALVFAVGLGAVILILLYVIG